MPILPICHHLGGISRFGGSAAESRTPRLLSSSLAAALALMLLGTPVSARDIYVDNVSGSDSNRGNTAQAGGPNSGPCRSITRALQLAQRDDTIIIANHDVPYYESITLQGAQHSGSEAAPFTVIGNGAVLDGSTPIPDEAWEHYQGEVFRYRPRWFQFQQLFYQERPLAMLPIADPNGSLPELQPLQWCFYQGHVYFRVETDRLPYQYQLTQTTRRVGITLYEVRNVVISDLVVQGFQLDGINCHDQANARLEGLLCRGNGRSGISIGGTSRADVVSCLLGSNGQTQLRTEGYCRASLWNCDLIEGGAPPYRIDGGQLLFEGTPLE